MALLLAKTAFLSLGLNYGVHYASARLYDTYCVPHSLNEIVRTFVSTASPVCGFLLQTMTLTQNNYAVVLTATLTTTLANVLKP